MAPVTASGVGSRAMVSPGSAHSLLSPLLRPSMSITCTLSVTLESEVSAVSFWLRCENVRIVVCKAYARSVCNCSCESTNIGRL